MIPLIIAKTSALPYFAAASCGSTGFFNFPPWWKYLNPPPSPPNCIVTIDLTNHLSNIWLIGLAILDMLLRVAGLAAVISIIVSAVMYITSAGSPDRAGAALNRIISSLVGLAIVVVAAAVVAFIGNRIG